jgi:hypothetical protein
MNTSAIARLAAILSPVAAAVAAAIAIGATGATGTAATPSASGGAPAVQTDTGTREHWYYDYTAATLPPGNPVCPNDSIASSAYGAWIPQAGDPLYGGLVDVDGDGYCNDNTSPIAGDDCQDGDVYIYPGALELCSNVGVDNDCSQGGVGADKTAIDMIRYYADGDSDGYGTGSGLLACAAPFGYDPDAGDCNDVNGAVNPGATEICDGINNDCDAYTDEGFTDTDSDGYADCVDPDKDGDGYDAGAGPSLDCDDYAAGVYPGALENCANLATDNDCDGIYSADEAVDSQDYYTDGDNDNYGTGTSFKECTDDTTRALADGDCDDANGAINPGATELCDGYDNNCAGTPAIDEGFPNYDGDSYADCVDTDDDNDGDPDTTDCSDNDAYVYTGAAETCANYGTDNDCDGDAYDAVGVNWYRDADGDGYGDAAIDVVGCADNVPTGYVTNNTDCYDGDAERYPGNVETVDNGKDNDCDGYELCYEDDDSDGYLDASGDTRLSANLACTDAYEGGSSTPTTDCNDNDGSIYPGATEGIADGVDQNCDGVELCYEDGDDDGYLDGSGDAIASADLYCTDAYESATNSPIGDCNDADPAVFPGAVETCANISVDNDCYAAADIYAEAVDSQDYYTDSDSDNFGTGSSFKQCTDDSTRALADGDCNDSNGAINPSATEICDGINNDCDAYTDEGFDDFDSDGYADCVDPDIDGDGYANGLPTDCDDYNTAVHQGALETCANIAVDNDCDGITSAAEAIDSADYYADADSDGYGAGASFKACAGDAYISSVAGDCADGDATRYPGAAEVCANVNVDNDCDGNAFEASDISAWAYDADGDGYGTDNPSQRIKACTAPNGYVANTDDCNDNAADVYLGAPELCSNLGVDNDCDGTGTSPSDDSEASDRPTWYADADNDTYGNASASTLACAKPDGYVSNDGDCNDAASYAWTGRAELCDGYDNDCDSSIDEGVTLTFYHDGDEDGFGDAYDSMQRCAAGDGYIANSTDCNDGNNAAYPGAAELCATSTIDNDCDGDATDVDEYAADKVDFYADTDGDGFTTDTTARFCSGTSNAGWLPVANPTDCDDAYADVYPGAAETCENINIDNDCDNNALEAEDAERYFRDGDGDGYGSGTVFQIACTRPTGWQLTSTDCNDGNVAIYPGAAELCATVGVDNDCDTYSDDVDADAADKVDFYADVDGDSWTVDVRAEFCPGTTNAGWGATLSSPVDCDDAYGDIYPGALETCANLGVNNDCDGDNDAAEAFDSIDYFNDVDQDGFGAGTAFRACADTDSTSAVSGDCNDGDGYINPGVAEVCDGVDNNCAAGIDEGFVDTDIDGSADCVDLDDDNDGDPDVYDCGPLDATRFHGAPELCATIGVDNDCDGNVNDATDFQALWIDDDGDGYGDRSTSAVKSCAGPNMASNNLDCNDDNPAIGPGAVEVCDGIDNDCDDLTDDADPGITGQSTWYRDQDGDGAGDAGQSTLACTQPDGYVATSGDGCPDVYSLQAPATWYRDQDIDGQGDPAQSTAACTQPTGYVANSTDGCPNTQFVYAQSDFYGDTDGDGYGDPAVIQSACSAPAGFVANSGDGCPDAYTLQAPATWFADTDADGFGDPDATETGCAAPAGYIAVAGDGCPTVQALQAAVAYYVDGDGDGYGSSTTVELCEVEATEGYSSVDGDCNDADGSVYSNIRYYRDADGDGDGDPMVFVDVCSAEEPEGYVTNANDGCPTDADKSAPGACGCNVPDTDSDGDGYADCVDTTPSLSLVASQSTPYQGTDIVVHVQLGARLSGQDTVGAQLAMHYDTSKLAFVSIAPGSSTAGDGLFSQPVFLNHTAGSGTILYGVGVGETYGGDTFATRVATITFTLADGVDAICDLAGLVEFDSIGGVSSMLSDDEGAAINVTAFDLGTITAYGSASGLIGVPESWTRPADAGVLGSVFADPGVTYVAPCESMGSSKVTLSVALASGGISSSWPEGGVFPVGTSTVTWSAGDMTASRTFTVLNYQLMDLTVSLDGGGIAPSSRELRVDVEGDVETVTATVGGSAAPAVIEIQVPVAASYSCVQVKDSAHSVSSAPAVSVSGVRYVASASLDQGDSNNDNTVDILDFGVYVAAFGPAAENAISNFDGNGFVNNVDFSFISFNFFKVGASCPGSSSMTDGGVASGEPRDRVSVAQLRKMGQGDLAMADLNADGWVDTRDIGLWLQGVRPAQDAGSAASGGSSAE